MHPIDAALQRHSITLPTVAPPAANYLPYSQSGSLLVISGQLPLQDGAVKFTGPVRDISEGQQAAHLCAINMLAQIHHALEGDWSRLQRCIRLGIFVQSAQGFSDAHQVANGASDLIVEIMGESGKHARAAVSVPGLPLNAMVEVDALMEVAG